MGNIPACIDELIRGCRPVKDIFTIPVEDAQYLAKRKIGRELTLKDK